MKTLSILLLTIFFLIGCSHKKPASIALFLAVDSSKKIIEVKYKNNTDSNYVITIQKIELYDKKNNYIFNYTSTEPEIRKIKSVGYKNGLLYSTLLDAYAQATCLEFKERRHRSPLYMDTCLESMRKNREELKNDSTINTSFLFIVLPARDSLVSYYTIENGKPSESYIFKVILPYNDNGVEYPLDKYSLIYIESLSKFIQPTGFYLYRGAIKRDSVWVKF